MKGTFFYAPRAELTERSQRKGKKGREEQMCPYAQNLKPKDLARCRHSAFCAGPRCTEKVVIISAASLLHPPGSWGSSGLPPFWCRTIVVVVPGYFPCRHPSSSTGSRARGTCAGGSCFRWSRGDSTASVLGSSPLALLRASPVEGRGLAVTSSGLRSPKVSSSLGVDHDVN